MSGSFRVEDAFVGEFHHPRSKDPKHDHVVIHLDSGKVVTYNDPRRFGFMDLAATAALDAIRGSWTSATSRWRRNSTRARLAALFAGSRAPLKAALLDQKRIAGLGNIYVCESLFRARLLPSRPAGILADARGGRPGRRRRSRRRSRRCWKRRSRRADRPCAITVRRTATSVISSTLLQSTTARISPA